MSIAVLVLEVVYWQNLKVKKNKLEKRKVIQPPLLRTGKLQYIKWSFLGLDGL